MRIVAVLVLAAVTAYATAAKAERIDALFEQFGLFGSWAADCSKPVSPTNAHVTDTTPSPGLVLETHDLGANYARNRYSMVSGQRLSLEQLSVEVIFQPGTDAEERETLVFLVRGDTRRTMFNQPHGGAVRVKDGIVLSRGSKTPVLNKCE